MRCFSSPGLLPSLALRMIGLATDRVSPFGNPGITACLQLPQAYRSLPRPSSPPCAKASTVRPYALDLSVSVVALNTTTHTLVSCQRANQSQAVGHKPQDLRLSACGLRLIMVERGKCGRQFRGLSIPFLTDGAYSALQKGGDPAAGSPTATLLRLRPSH